MHMNHSGQRLRFGGGVSGMSPQTHTIRPNSKYSDRRLRSRDFWSGLENPVCLDRRIKSRWVYAIIDHHVRQKNDSHTTKILDAHGYERTWYVVLLVIEEKVKKMNISFFEQEKFEYFIRANMIKYVPVQNLLLKNEFHCIMGQDFPKKHYMRGSVFALGCAYT